MRKLLPVIALLASCAPLQVLRVDPQLEDYVRRFEKAGGLTVSNVIVEFGDTGPVPTSGSYTVGYCQSGGTPKVVISKTYFMEVEDAQREELMFHELGHCVLDRGHTSTEYPDGCPTSIMDPYMINEWCYDKWRSEYLEELFSGGENDD